MTSRKKQYDNLFNNLNNFMLTNDNIIRYISINEAIKTNSKLLNKKQEKTKESTNIFVPKQRDMLFWCFYIILNSKEQYLFNFKIKRQKCSSYRGQLCTFRAFRTRLIQF